MFLDIDGSFLIVLSFGFGLGGFLSGFFDNFVDLGGALFTGDFWRIFSFFGLGFALFLENTDGDFLGVVWFWQVAVGDGFDISIDFAI